MPALPRPAADHPLAKLTTFLWHYVRDDDAEPRVGAGRVRPDAFDAQLDRIGRRFTVVDWPTVASALDGGAPLPVAAALLTFDDGLVDHHATVLPRLEARGWPAVFFVMARRPGDRLSVGHRIHILLADRSPTQLRDEVVARLGPADRQRFEDAETRERAAGVDAIDVVKRPLQRDLADTVGPILSALIEERHGTESDVADELHLSPQQLVDLRAAGMTIGGHGLRHLWLDHEPMGRVRDEIDASAALVAGDRAPAPFAYPYGAGRAEAPDLLAKAGFTAAFHASPTVSEGRWDLGRVDAEDRTFDAAIEEAGR
ncbi:MAG: polysaccharide deacetylase family protein [Chloroflexota bacterium]